MLHAVLRILYGILVGVCIRCAARDPDFTEPDQPCDGGENCPSKAFRDVPGPSNWAHAGIDYCVKNKLMNGVGGDRFSPEGTVTRAQLVTILYRVAGSPETAFKGTFTDVADEQWYSLPIEWAAANGIVNGVGGGRFNPEGKITREQIAAILYRYAGSPEVEGSLSTFPDAASVSAYAVNALIWATQQKLINGINLRERDEPCPRLQYHKGSNCSNPPALAGMSTGKQQLNPFPRCMKRCKFEALAFMQRVCAFGKRAPKRIIVHNGCEMPLRCRSLF